MVVTLVHSVGTKSADLFSIPAEGMKKADTLHPHRELTLTEMCGQTQGEQTGLTLSVPRASREDPAGKLADNLSPSCALPKAHRLQSLPEGASPRLLELVFLCSSCLCRYSRKGFGSR